MTQKTYQQIKYEKSKVPTWLISTLIAMVFILLFSTVIWKSMEQKCTQNNVVLQEKIVSLEEEIENLQLSKKLLNDIKTVY